MPASSRSPAVEEAWACGRWLLRLSSDYSPRAWRETERLSLATSAQWADGAALEAARTAPSEGALANLAFPWWHPAPMSGRCWPMRRESGRWRKPGRRCAPTPANWRRPLPPKRPAATTPPAFSSARPAWRRRPEMPMPRRSTWSERRGQAGAAVRAGALFRRPLVPAGGHGRGAGAHRPGRRLVRYAAVLSRLGRHGAQHRRAAEWRVSHPGSHPPAARAGGALRLRRDRKRRRVPDLRRDLAPATARRCLFRFPGRPADDRPVRRGGAAGGNPRRAWAAESRSGRRWTCPWAPDWAPAAFSRRPLLRALCGNDGRRAGRPVASAIR